MKSNQVSILVVLLLCLVMGGFLYVVDRSSDDEKGWNPSELYSELGARSYEGSSFSDVTFSGGASSDGVAVSMRNGSFSLRTRVRHASSPNSLIANGVPGKSADSWGALSPNSPIASSPNAGVGLISHMTSSAEYHSFGGGNNMAMGSYTSSSNSLIASSPAIGSYSPSPSSLITSSPNNLIAYSPSNGEVQVAAEQVLMSANSSASGLFGGMMTSYGTASYEDYYTSSPNRVNNRFNAPPGAGGSGEGDDGSAYEAWLKWMAQFGSQFGEKGEGNTLNFGNEEAYKSFCMWYFLTYGYEYDPSNSLTPPAFTYEQWLKWFTSNGGSHEYEGWTYNFTPVGDIWPLLLMVLAYICYLRFRRYKSMQ